MDTQTILNGAFLLATGIGGWFAREIWGAVKELRADIHQLEIELPSNYVRKDEFTDALKDFKKELNEGFNRIYDKLDGKADK